MYCLLKQEKDKDRDSYGWLLCTSRSGHDPDKLMPTQIIAGKALECMGHLVHSYRRQHSIIQFCDCPEAIESNKAIKAAAAANSENNGTNYSGDSNGVCKVLFFLKRACCSQNCVTQSLLYFNVFLFSPPLESNCSQG